MTLQEKEDDEHESEIKMVSIACYRLTTCGRSGYNSYKASPHPLLQPTYYMGRNIVKTTLILCVLERKDLDIFIIRLNLV